MEEDWEFGGGMRTKPRWGGSGKAEARGEGMGHQGDAGDTGTVAERTETGQGTGMEQGAPGGCS